jgi:hypothetical protein
MIIAISRKMMLSIVLVIANISGTIIQSNQTHLIVSTGNDWSTVSVVTIVGIIGALLFSGYTVWKGIKDRQAAQVSHQESIEAQKVYIIKIKNN